MKKNNQLSIKPYGGLGEIGSNMVAISTKLGTVVIDAGILFPNEDFFEINYLIPNYDDIDQSKEIHFFITHGHEDHIGAISHVAKDFPNATIHTPRFAANLIRKKLQQRNIARSLEIYRDGMELELIGLTFSPVQLNHSIPDTFGIIITTPLNDKIFYASDFKVDHNVKFESKFDSEKITEMMGESRTRLCLFDSTNILNEGKTNSESDLEKDLSYLISQKKRKFITLFSSNIHRVKTILNLAIKHHQKVVPVGRSIQHYIEAGAECNILTPHELKTIRKEDSITNPNDENLVILLTGCQGDHKGALRRVSSNEHKLFKLKPNDLVIFSSKVIPGNEKIVYKIYNKITELGTKVITTKDFEIHASGHAAQEDLKTIINASNPTHYIPIHGESYFLEKHKEFIQKHYPNVWCETMLNFSVAHLDINGEISIEASDVLEPKIIHGNDLEIERSKISERRKIATSGLITVACYPDKGKVSFEFRGLPEVLDSKKDDFYQFLEHFINTNKKANKNDLTEELRVRVRNYFKDLLGYRPIAIIHVL